MSLLHEEQFIAQIAKRAHSSARITKPKPTAEVIFRSKIMASYGSHHGFPPLVWFRDRENRSLGGWRCATNAGSKPKLPAVLVRRTGFVLDSAEQQYNRLKP